MTFELARQYAEALVDGPFGGTYRLFTSKPAEAEVLHNTLYRFTLVGGPQSRRVTLGLFLGMGGLGGALWEQELRTLQRLGGFEHPALPEFLDGGRLEGIAGDAGAAYVRTFLDGEPSDRANFEALIAVDRSQLVPHLWHVADALGLLHAANVSHRGLWPGALFALPEPSKEGRATLSAVKLARFEMSALLANLFNRRESDANFDQLRAAYLAEDPRSLLYTPPERLRFVFSRPDGELGGPPGDVFSLGMVAAEWLVTGTPSTAPCGTYHDILSYQREVRRRVHVDTRDLPGQLVEILYAALDPRPSERPTAYEVAQAFARSYADAQLMLSDDVPDKPYVVLYMAKESDKLLLNQWKLYEDSAMTEEGKVQLTELVENDMRGAEILHCPTGAEGFAHDNLATLHRAKTVIVGAQVTWFCEVFYTPRWVGPPRMFPELLVIKYVRRTEDINHRLERLRVNSIVRRIPMVEAVPAPMENEAVAEMLSAGRPVWSRLIDEAESSRANTAAERTYLDSLEWYLKYQHAMLDARTYLYQVAPSEDGGFRIHLRWDEAGDRTRPGADGSLSKSAILDQARPAMAVFVAGGDELDASRVQLANEFSPDWVSAPTYDVVEIKEPDTVVIAIRGKRRPPERGWLRLSGDAGTPPQIARQNEALLELTENRTLLRHLLKPTAEWRPSDRWATAGGTLLGDGRDAVRAILEHDGLFAVQGPPGTGKTEVTSQAVVDLLRCDPGARILVSAQSHDALENLALRITRKLGITAPAGSGKAPSFDRLALRVKTRNYDSHPELRDLEPAKLAESVRDYSVRKAQQWLASERAELPGLVPVVQRWIERAATTMPELDRRVRNAANVVFATTGSATKRQLFVEATQEPFDWVIIEEAGRAWPTELALPMVRGLRWTLVGDHAQIGAFSRSDVERFLETLGGYENDELKAMFEARQTHSDNFGTFARLFREPGKGPTRVLTEQYRMHHSIGNLVGDIFYANSGGLKTMRDPAPYPLNAPRLLRDRRLVWIDTGDAERSRFDGSWANEHEAAICSDLVRAMRPLPGSPKGPSLAVLTPYRDQVAELTARLSEHSDKIFTVDRFQGREADVVVASLVRDRVRAAATVSSTVGFVADPTRINVLLSRAREVLIIVGRFDLFSNCAGPHWRDVTDRFQSDGLVLPADHVRSY